MQGTRTEGASKSLTTFVKNIGYDTFGQRTFILHGNGVRTDYTYDEERRWLEGLKSANSYGQTLQNLDYTFDKVGNITTRTDTNHYAAAEHRYEYDGLYQLTEASGDYTNYPYGPNAVTGSNWKRSYKQTYEYDAFFNMSRKTSSDRRSPMSTSFSSLLNYELAYEYSPEKPHQAARIGERYYGYDANGNLIEESSAPIGQSEAGEAPREQRIGDVRRVDQGWGYEFDTEEKENVYRRFFKWDSENRLTSVSEGADVTSFLYDADGERTSKLGERGERLYFNAWWTATEEGSRYRYSKHIFVGSERIVTRLRASTGNWAAEDATTYWYHPDHLGSTSVVTDPDGEAYERIEYTPFGRCGWSISMMRTPAVRGISRLDSPQRNGTKRRDCTIMGRGIWSRSFRGG